MSSHSACLLSSCVGRRSFWVAFAVCQRANTTQHALASYLSGTTTRDIWCICVKCANGFSAGALRNLTEITDSADSALNYTLRMNMHITMHMSKDTHLQLEL